MALSQALCGDFRVETVIARLELVGVNACCCAELIVAGNARRAAALIRALMCESRCRSSLISVIRGQNRLRLRRAAQFAVVKKLGS
jgi:hypothetical protein